MKNIVQTSVGIIMICMNKLRYYLRWEKNSLFTEHLSLTSHASDLCMPSIFPDDRGPPSWPSMVEML